MYQDLISCYPDDKVSFEDLNKSVYLDCVINESLRLHPALNRILRVAINDYDFGEFKIQKGQVVGVSIYSKLFYFYLIIIINLIIN